MDVDDLNFERTNVGNWKAPGWATVESASVDRFDIDSASNGSR